MTLSFRGRLVASRGDKLQRYGATWYHPFLSSWDRDQENSAFAGRELFRQAYSTPPDLYRPSSEQAKRAGPNMTDEGNTVSHHTVVVWAVARRVHLQSSPLAFYTAITRPSIIFA